MNLLALDTTTDACSVALQCENEMVEQHHVEARAHTRILLPMIRGLLAGQGLSALDLAAVILGNGPGSFIGMRISASVAQGLCYAAGLPLVPVSSLAAVAAEVMENEAAEKVAVAQDARMNEVYFAAYRRGADGLPTLQDKERLLACDRADAGLRDSGWTAAGGGWQRYPQLAAACGPSLSNTSTVTVPRARCLLRLGEQALRKGGGIDPQALQPAYLRTTVAQVSAG
jgi:tRNA threonylcarbamoyladenosine biosynthesis protein TsaB